MYTRQKCSPNIMANPSVMYPPDGYTNPNPNGLFRPITTNYINSYPMGMNDFNKSFQPNAPIIEKHNFRNMNEVIYNNLGENLLNEHITEYRINTESADRSLNVYPDPFKYTITFAPASRQTSTLKINTNPIQVTFEGDAMPHINRDFVNIKYIRLDHIILPRYTTLTFDTVLLTTTPVITTDLFSEKFLIIKFKELKNIYTFGTSTLIENGFRLMPDKTLGFNAFSAIPYYVNLTYPDSLLENLNRLTFELYDSSGNQIFSSYNIYQNGIPLFNNLSASQIYANQSMTLTSQQVQALLDNTLIQNEMSLILGVVENQLDTNTKYEK